MRRNARIVGRPEAASGPRPQGAASTAGGDEPATGSRPQRAARAAGGEGAAPRPPRATRVQGGTLALPALRDAAAAASVGGAADAAHQALAAGGSAVDAVVAGFFAAAGLDAGVLLGAAAAIVGNAGSGVRAFDGRPLQPGKGAPRPRGFVEGVPVPDAARIAVPRSVPMLMLLHAYGGRASLSTLARYGAEAASSVGAKTRAKVLRRVGAAGPLGLRTEGVHDALLAAGNSVAGGSLTEADLDSVLPADADGRTLGGGEGGASISVWPWAGEGALEVDPGWIVDVITAADARGGVAAFAYAHQERGVALPGVELAAPIVAVPVRRGVTRVTPGAELQAPAPIGIVRVGRELALSFGLAGGWARGDGALFTEALDVSAFAGLAEGGAVETALASLARANGGARSIAAVRSPRSTRAAVVLPDVTG